MLKQMPIRTRSGGPTRSASIVFFHYADSPFLTLAQETLRLKLAMEDYDLKILLKHDVVVPALDIREGDEKAADIKEAPTKDNLVKYILQAAQEGYYIDLWICAHGNRGSFAVSPGDPKRLVTFSEAEMRQRLGPEASGMEQLPIRMVWSTLCHGETLNDTWLDLGAKVVSGARNVNFTPHEFGRFTKSWNKGNMSFAEAIERSNTTASRTAVHVYLSTMDAPATRKKQWGGCPAGRTILGKHDCARDYFINRWDVRESEFPAGMSGKQFINYASEKIIAGQRTLTKNTVPVW